MSDERTATHPSAPVHFEHWCEHPGCKKWGGFGFERDKTKTDWFCMEHRPETYRGQPVRRNTELQVGE
ncbi:hypothetical protein [Neorhizobium tomejilense]|uniref:hypothetical protein n=1 Tax=Neorhizobium tomejilense TaxID=2093828 RepID=UPI000CFA44A5|nr:hypothetical protein [Neorhizobium tomejilense]